MGRKERKTESKTPKGMNNDKRITKWKQPNSPMAARFNECPECHTIGNERHDMKCSQPPMQSRHIKTTQFGPCNFGQWCEKMAEQLLNKGVKAQIVKAVNGSGDIALFEC